MKNVNKLQKEQRELEIKEGEKKLCYWSEEIKSSGDTAVKEI